MQSDAQASSVTVNGLRLATRAIRNPAATETVYMLHGWLDNLASFEHLSGQLSPLFNYVMLDWPGHGLSDWNPGGYPITLYTQVLAELLTNEASPCHLIGHSMGAAACLMVAGCFPEQVKSAVLIDAIGPLTSPAGQACENLRKAILGQRRAKPFRVYENEAIALQARLQSSPSITPDCMLPLVRRGLQQQSGGVQWRMDPALRLPSIVRLSDDMADSFTAAIECQVLAIQAINGLFEESLFDRRLREIKQLKRIKLPGHHHLHMDPEYSAPVATAINDFLESHQ